MRGFTIGRYQPYHEGHHRFVEHIAEEVDELVVAVGSAGDSHTRHDPFTAGERVQMITRSLADIDCPTYVVPVEDLDRNSVWVSHVRSMCPPFEVAYSNNPLVVRLFEEAGIEVRSSTLFNRRELEGEEVRRRMIAGDDWEPLVPDAVAAVVDEVDGVNRIRAVSETDEPEDEPVTDHNGD